MPKLVSQLNVLYQDTPLAYYLTETTPSNQTNN